MQQQQYLKTTQFYIFLLKYIVIKHTYIIICAQTEFFRGRKCSRKVNLKYFREKIFSRIYCSRKNIFPRKYLPAKITSRENIFSRKYLPAIFFRAANMWASRPRLCGLSLLFHNLEDPIQLGFVQQ